MHGRKRNQTKKYGLARQYHLSFSATSTKSKKDQLKLRLTRDLLPPAPKGWHQMIRHQFADEFKKAAEIEYRTLEEKGTWSHEKLSNVSCGAEVIPVIWIFSNKFDSDGILTKFNARLCARGDLQVSEEETYAITLASRSFRAMMAITAAHDRGGGLYDQI